MSPAGFLMHVDRVLSVALQTGNAGVAMQGTAELHVQAYRRGFDPTGYSQHHGRSGPGKHHQAHYVQHSAISSGLSGYPLDLSSIVHADVHSARVGVRRAAAA